jgi:TIR domain
MVKLLFSYSHKDEELRDQLDAHLSLLKRQEELVTWHDRRITAGEEIDKAIRDELESSQIILLLISANFLASNYCYEKEMQRAIERHNNGTSVVIPVILHPCDWQTAPFGKLRATPTDGVPISKYPNQHEAFAIVAKDIRLVVEGFLGSNKVVARKVDQKDAETQTSDSYLSSTIKVKRNFGDLERDKFLEESYEYIARYFKNSLREMSSKNSHIDTQFKRLNDTKFTAFVYSNSQRVAQCTIGYGSSIFKLGSITFSTSGNANENSFNESISVEDDEYNLYLRPLGMAILGMSSKSKLSQQEAAEYYWEILIAPLK